MALPFFNWSRTAANNATADSTVNWSEGQAPSSVNDSARAMMASTAAYRDDIAGAIVTGGTSTAYTVTSYQIFDTLAHLNGMQIAFTPHTTSTGTMTLNVDSLGAKPLRSAPSTELPSGTLVQGTPYVAVYNNSDGAFYLQSFYSNPYNVPLGASMDYWGASAPNSAFAFAAGQQISQSTYQPLYLLFGTNKYGTDSGGLFFLPDLRGRIIAGKDDMGGSAASRLTSSWFGVSAASLGAVGGDEKSALSSTNQLPTFTPSGSITNGAITFPSVSISSAASGGTNAVATGGFSATGNLTSPLNPSQAPSGFSGNAIGSASPSSFRTCQPTIIANKIIRIL